MGHDGTGLRAPLRQHRGDAVGETIQLVVGDRLSVQGNGRTFAVKGTYFGKELDQRPAVKDFLWIHTVFGASRKGGAHGPSDLHFSLSRVTERSGPLEYTPCE